MITFQKQMKQSKYLNEVRDKEWKQLTEISLMQTGILNSGDDEAPLVMICHGLQLSSDSPLVKDMTIALKKIEMDTAYINFQVCSGEIN